MFSLTDFSPLSIIPRHYRLVVFKGYFDGGNQADSTQYDIVTLAAFSGSAIQWNNFDKIWQAKLKTNGAPETPEGHPWLHTTDAIGLTGEFSKRRGWNQSRVHTLIRDCVKVISTCAAVRKDTLITHAGLRPASVSVLLKDFKRAILQIPDLGTVEHICATQCSSPVMNYGIHVNYPENVKFEFYFDRNEPFRRHLQDRVNNKRSRRFDPIWKNVYSIAELDMRYGSGLQAADLLAWTINDVHKHNGPRFDWQEPLLKIDRDEQWFDYDRLVKPQRDKMDIVKTWNMGKRKQTR